MSDLPLKSKISEIFPRKRIELRPGVHLWISSGVLEHKLQRKASTTAPILELAYSRKKTLHSEMNRASVEIQPGYSHLGFLGQTTGYSEYNCGEEVEVYSIWVEPAVFDSFCHAVGGSEKTCFRSFLGTTSCYYHFKHDAREEGILNALSQSLFSSEDRMNFLLLESRILELLSINIERLLCSDRTDGRTLHLTSADAERLHNAREILLHRLDCPPSLLELAHMIQMNDFKLKRLFKQYFGKTVYQYIREQRLEKAFFLLQDQRYNVSESAFAVGYTNISHFSEAFRSYFGISPKALRKNR